MLIAHSIIVCVLAQGSASDDLFAMQLPLHRRLPVNVDPVRGFSSSIGASVALSDVDGDGQLEITAGAPTIPGEGLYDGAVLIFDSVTSNPLAILRSPFPNIEYFGYSVASADIDHDGYAEVVSSCGPKTVIFHGRTLGVRQVLGRPTLKILTGDFNGDGNPDLALLGTLASEAGAVYFGPEFTTVVNLPLLPNVILYSNGVAGDLNHDGKDDVLLAHDNGNGYGQCWISLGPDFLTTQEIRDPEPTAAGLFGTRLAIADFNDDGWNDCLITSLRTPCTYPLCEIASYSSGRITIPTTK